MRLRKLISSGKQPLPAPNPRRPEAEADSGISGTGSPRTSEDANLGTVAALTLADDADPQAEQNEAAWHMNTNQDLWKEAYTTVKEDPEYGSLLSAFEKYVESGHAATMSGSAVASPTTEDAVERHRIIQKSAEEKVRNMSSNQLSFSIGGKPVVIREVVRKAVKTVTFFKDVIGSAISAEPHAALAWAGIMAVLPLLENSLQQDEDAANGLQNIIFLLLRYRNLQETFLSRLTAQEKDQPQSTRDLLLSVRTKIISIYAQVIVYEIRFVLQFARGRVLRALRNAVAADGWKDMWESIESTSRLVDEGVRGRLALSILQTVEDIMAQVEEMKTSQLAIHESVKDGNETSLLLQLPCASNALFDSDEIVRTEAECLNGTQVATLNAVQAWAKDSTEPPILWMHGMAGTGKSSVALTVANALSQQREFSGDGYEAPRDAFLGASFFFKQDDASRNNTKMFFTTIARRLAHEFPDLKVLITSAVQEDLNIGTSNPAKQFRDLVMTPLSSMDQGTIVPVRLIVVVDALDECVSPREIEILLSIIQSIIELRHLQLRFFITSRPDQHIISEFNKLPESAYRSLILHKVKHSLNQVDNTDDITKYLRYTLGLIGEKRRVRPGWVDDEGIARLGAKAEGLFIYAATVCRFLDTEDLDDEETQEELLDLIFDDSSEFGAPQHKVDEIYLKVLRFPSRDKSPPKTKQRFFALIENILGLVAVFFEPVSSSSLASFLSVDRDLLQARLGELRSVISVPDDKNLPLSLVHLSFRDFLLSEERSQKLSFRIEEAAMHRKALSRCLAIMSEDLQQDMCDLVVPGRLVSEIPSGQVDKKITGQLRYACTYWVDHLAQLSSAERVGLGLKDDGAIHVFLREKALFWLEATSLIGKAAAARSAVNRLATLISANLPVTRDLARLVQDTNRFATLNAWVIEQAPLQIYCSALLFSPLVSEIRKEYAYLIPTWITRVPRVDDEWPSQVSILDGHKTSTVAAFFPSESLMVSGSHDRTTTVWDYITGIEIQRFVEPSVVMAVAVSPDGRLIASGCSDGTIQIRDPATGMTVGVLTGKGRASVDTIIFSPKDMNILASLSVADAVRIWNIREAREIHCIDCNSYRISFGLAFAPDGDFIAVGCDDHSKIYGVQHGELRKIIGDHENARGLSRTAVSISPDGESVISMTDHTYRVQLWDPLTGHAQREYASGRFVSFGPCGDLVAQRVSHGHQSVIEIRRTTTWELVGEIREQDQPWTNYDSVVFSHDSKLAATVDHHGLIQLWELASLRPGTNETCSTRPPERVNFLSDGQRVIASGGKKGIIVWSPESHSPQVISHFHRAAVSPDKRMIILCKEYGEPPVEIWDGALLQRLVESDTCAEAVFSPDNRLVALMSPFKMQIVDTRDFSDRGTIIFDHSLVARGDPAGRHFKNAVFSPDGRILSVQGAICEFWDPSTGKKLWSREQKRILAFSPDSLLVALSYEEGGNVHFHNSATGIVKATVVRRIPSREIIAFHSNNHLVAGCHRKSPLALALWDVESGDVAFELVLSERSDIEGHVTSLTISNANILAVSYGRLDGEDHTVQLWDLDSRRMIRRLSIDTMIFRLSISTNHLYLNSDIGRIPLPPLLADDGTLMPMTQEASEATADCLYVARCWICQAFDRLIWLPPAYRKLPLDVQDGTVALGLRTDKVLFIGIDLKATPLSSRQEGVAKEEIWEGPRQ